MRPGNTVRLPSQLVSQKTVMATMLDTGWLGRGQAGLYPWGVSL